MTSLGKRWKYPHPFSKEHRKKLSLSHNGKVGNFFGKHHTESAKKVIGEKAKGRKKSPKAYVFPKGKHHWNWKGGVSLLRNKLWHTLEYRQWRSDIFTRDDFTCQNCQTKGGDLEAHHIKELYKIIDEYKIKNVEQALNCEELWNLNNGTTLCRKCHNLTKRYARRKSK